MSFWRGRSVFLTGHSGFKGGWLTLYLTSLGARVHGYGRPRTAGLSLYDAANVRARLASETVADVKDLASLRRAIDQTRPDVVFHLAARAIVREALSDPVGTIRANVVGSASVLEAVRDTGTPVVLVTTDKVYRNRGEAHAFREDDQLGGLDPYGASKAAVELVADSYRHTYGVKVVTARCANVIGGGDWGPYRILPACVEAFSTGKPVVVHDAVRVFLHALDAAEGYAMLAERMLGAGVPHTAYNFGPLGAHRVPEVAAHVAHVWGADPALVQLSGGAPQRESKHLDIDSTRARAVLGWTPRWSLEEAIHHTVAWHKAQLVGADMELITVEQLAQHAAAVRERAA
jgi:CDP-glucose 4,6-dehydratase